MRGNNIAEVMDCDVSVRYKVEFQLHTRFMELL